MITPTDISEMSYTDFVSLIQEENRPSGGKWTVSEIARTCFLNKDSNILEVGCTNGFTTIELATTVKCRVVGIDINPRSVEVANARAESLQGVEFQTGSAYELQFPDASFDLVMAGNATSFMADKARAVSEYIRVTKQYGFIALVPIWYRVTPPSEVLDEVSKIIGVPISPRNKEMWMELITQTGLEIYRWSDYEFLPRSGAEISEYLDHFMQKPNLRTVEPGLRACIEERWRNTISVFNTNLSYAAFSIVVLRKRPTPEEPEILNKFRPYNAHGDNSKP